MQLIYSPRTSGISRPVSSPSLPSCPSLPKTFPSEKTNLILDALFAWNQTLKEILEWSYVTYQQSTYILVPLVIYSLRPPATSRQIPDSMDGNYTMPLPSTLEWVRASLPETLLSFNETFLSFNENSIKLTETFIELTEDFHFFMRDFTFF